MANKMKLRSLFWFLFGLMTIAKLVIVSDMAVHIRYSPFDDSLYVSRAFNFLNGDAWGEYDPYVLAKLPGMSLWLIGSRLLGIPYLLGINLLYSLAGLILLLGVRKLNVKSSHLLLCYAIFVANPITFSFGWVLVMREAVSVILTIAMLGISLNILARTKVAIPIGWIVGFSIVFSCSLMLREEDQLLWVYLLLFAFAILYPIKKIYTNQNDFRLVAVLTIACIFFSGLAVHAARSYNQQHYGLPIINDYSEGEFPKLMATLRSIDSSVDNRLVMLPQEVIKRLISTVPDFVPVLNRLPAPGVQTFSCKLQGLCDEWSNGWMPWWIKKAAADASLTPSLVAGQEYFKSIRERIEGLCESGSLTCHVNGRGIIPPMQLRWFRSYVDEFGKLVGMLIYPSLEIVQGVDYPINAAQSIVEIYQKVTMTNVTVNPAVSDARSESGDGLLASPRSIISGLVLFLNCLLIVFGLISLLWRWVMYPMVSLSPIFLLCTIFWIFSIVRLSALSYVAVFLGQFETRIIFSTYSGLAVLGYLAILDAVRARHAYNAEGSLNA